MVLSDETPSMKYFLCFTCPIDPAVEYSIYRLFSIVLFVQSNFLPSLILFGCSFSLIERIREGICRAFYYAGKEE